jgi:hypothetical protein
MLRTNHNKLKILTRTSTWEDLDIMDVLSYIGLFVETVYSPYTLSLWISTIKDSSYC